MIYYICMLTSVVFLTMGGRHAGDVRTRRIANFVAIGILVAFAGIRDRTVGTDTSNYVRMFERIVDTSSVVTSSTEPGFVLLIWLSKLFSHSYVSSLTFIAAAVVIPYSMTIVRMVKRYEAGFFIFITQGAYTFGFNGARQAIAAAVCFWSIRYVIDRKLFPFLICVATATLFHKTALVAVALYFVAWRTVGLFRLASVGVLISGIAIYIDSLTLLAADLLNDRYSIYGQSIDRVGGVFTTAFLCAQGAALYALRSYAASHAVAYNRLLNIYIVALVPAIVTVLAGLHPSGLMRVHWYFSTVSILMWPMVFDSILDRRSRSFVGIPFFLVNVAHFVLATMAFSNLTPYRLNWELL